MAKALNVNLSVTADTSAAKAQLQQLQQALTELTSNSANLKVGLDSTALKQASTAADQLSLHLKNATNVNTGTLDFTKLSASIRASGSSLQEYGNQLLKMGPQGQQAFSQLAAAISKSEIPMTRLKGLLGEFGTVLTNTVRWQVASSAIHGMMSSIQHAFSYAQQLNKSLNNIQIVTGLSDTEMANFAESANKAAKSLNTTTTSYTNAALIYYQQGIRDQKQIAERVETTIKLANVSGQSAETVSNQMTAIWNNFDNGTRSLESYADVITALGAATASSSEEIATGLSKFAAIADTVGLSYENATAALATITATTRQSADTVGTGLRTLFARLQSLKLGETLEDGVNLTKYTKALETIGVKVLDAAGNMRSMNDILDDMGQKWQTLTDAQKTATAQTVGGVRQYTTLMALMENYDFYKENLQIAQDSEGALQKQADIYAKSWEAAQKRVKTSAESIYKDLINDDFFIGLNNTFARFLTFLDNVIDGLGGLKSLLPGIAALLMSTFSDKISANLVNFATTLQTLKPGSAAAFRAERDSFLENAAYSLSGLSQNQTLSQSQQTQLAMAQKEITMQQAYVANQRVMSEFDRQYAQQQMDRYSGLRQSYAQLSNKVASNDNLLDSRRSSLVSKANDDVVKTLAGSALKANDKLAGSKEARELFNQIKASNGSFQDWFDKDGKFSNEQYWNSFNQGLNGVTDSIKQIEQNKTAIKDFTDTSQKGIQELTKELTGRGFKDADSAIQSILNNDGSINEEERRKLLTSLTTQQNDTVNQFANQWGLSAQAVSQYREAIIAAAGDEEKLAQIAKQIQETEEKATTAVNKRNQAMQTAQTITGVATALTSMASSANSASTAMTNILNFGKNGGGFSQLTGIVSGLGSSLLMMSMTAKTLLTTFTGLSGPVGWIIAAIPAVLGIINSLYQYFKPESQEEKTERLTKELSDTKSWAEQASNAIDDLMSKKVQHNNLLDELNQLTEGTQEFYDALIRANQQADVLISRYHLAFGQDYSINNRGAIEFTEKGNAELEAQAQAQAFSATYQSQVAAMTLQQSHLGDKETENQVMKLLENPDGSFANSSIDLNRISREYQAWKTDSDENYNKDFSAYLKEERGLTLKDFESQYYDALKNNPYGTTEALMTKLAQRYTIDWSTVAKTLNVDKKLNMDDLQMGYAIQELGKDFDPDTFIARVEEKEKKITESGQSLQELYRNTLGFYPDEEIAEDEALMKKQIARAQAINENVLPNLLEYQKKSLFLSQFKDYKDVDLVTLDSYITDLEKNTMGEDAVVVDYAKRVLESYYQGITTSVDDRLKTLGLRKSVLTGNEEEGYWYETQGPSAKDLSKLGMSGSDLNQWLQLQNNAEKIFGEDFSKNLGKMLIGDGEEFKASLQGALSTVDWSSTLSSILDLARLSKRALLENSINAKDLQSIYTEAFNEVGGNKGLLEELYKTEEFQDSLKDLQKQFKKTGKLSAKDIMETADSCEILNDYLEYGDQSASALAAAIELMGTGGASSIDQISEAFLAAMGAAGAFEDQLQDVFKFIDEFSPDRSIQDIADFFSKTSDDMFTELGNGNYGGERLYQEAAAIWGDAYASHLKNFFIEQQTEALENDLGPEALQEAYKEQFEAFDDVMQTVAKEGNMRAYWDFLLEGGGDQILGQEVNGEYGYSNVIGENGERLKISEALREHAGITNIGKNGDIEADLQGRTTEMFTQDVADALGISYDEAAIRVQEMSGKSAALTHDLKRNDAAAGLAALGEKYTDHGEITAQGVERGFKEMSWAEQTAFLQKYGDVLTEVDAEMGTHLAQLNEQRKAERAEIATLRAAGADRQTMNQSIADTVAAQEDLIATTEANGKTYTDFGQTMSNLTSAGYTQQEVLQAVADGAIDLGDAAYVVEDAFGNKIPVELQKTKDGLIDVEKTMSEAEKAIHDSNVAHDAEIQAKAFVEAFAGANIEPVDITVNVNGQESVTTVKEAIGSLENKNVDINVSDNGTAAAVQTAINNITGKDISITINGVDNVSSMVDEIIQKNSGKSIAINLNGTGGTGATGGYVPFGSHARGTGPVQSHRLRPGISLTGEEGKEIVWNKEKGYSYIVGENHPEFVTLYPGDKVFNAQETAEILGSSALGGKVYESNADSSYSGGVGPKGKYGKTGSGGGDGGKTKDFTPERYHVIKRQIQDLEFWYQELEKARENAYGTNILEAIDDEIKATDELLKAQKALVDEAEQFKNEDLKKLQDLSEKYDFKLELDGNGNITNWDDLQTKYAAAAQNKDETAKEIWDAIKQYEESIDEWQADFSKMTDLQLQKAELQLERITEKREMKIEFDEREIKLLDFYIKRIENSVYNTAKVIDKTSEKFKFIRDQADAAYESIDLIFEKLVDSHGNNIRKADGTAYTLDDWIKLTPEDRDALDINYNFGEELEKSYDQILEALEQFDELKTDAIDRFSKAFQELDENIENTIGLFDHYKNILSTLKDIGDLQGVTLAPEMEKVLEQINQNMFDNIQRTIQASQKEYEFIQQQKAKLQEETDKMIERYGKEDERVIAAQKQLDEYENRMRTLEEDMVGSWQEGLSLIQDWFNSTMEKIVKDYESSITGMYQTADEFEKAWDQQKSVEDHYVKDYERYYQISKLQRSITKDLENAAKAGNKQNERMKRLYNDLNKAREDGAEVTAYDLDIFAKRYEYEKALMELEDARNAKNEVRLQRDANGNWGYVYTSSADDDDLIAKQQKVDDTFYALQKTSQDQLASLSDMMMSRMTSIGARLKELYGENASPERIKEYLDLMQKQLDFDREDIETALRDAGMTADEAKLRYGADGFDILDNFNETLLSSITGNETLDELMNKLGITISETDANMQSAVDAYNERIKAINSWFEKNGETAAEAIGRLATGFNQKSEETLESIPGKIQAATEILNNTFKSMQDYHTKWDEEVGKIKNRLDDILTALHQLNAIEISPDTEKMTAAIVHMDNGGYTGSWGSSGKIAMLHEKENVFDKYDTLNLLNAAQILRTLDLQTNLFSKGLGNIITPWINDLKSQTLEQNVHIDATFPNVQDHNEIELAFDNLINKATQYANRKNMSAMTFQDMYTTKF